MNNNIITVENIPISVVNSNDGDYICISDIAKAKGGNTVAKDVVKNWIRNRYTLEFLSTWELLYNPSLIGSNSTPLKLKQDFIHLL